MTKGLENIYHQERLDRTRVIYWRQ